MVLCDFIAMAKGWKYIVKWVKSKYPDTSDAKAAKDHGCNSKLWHNIVWGLQLRDRFRHHPLEVLALLATVPAAWWHLKYRGHGWVLVRLILICRNTGIEWNWHKHKLFAYFLGYFCELIGASWVGGSASRFRRPKFEKQAAGEGSV